MTKKQKRQKDKFYHFFLGAWEVLHPSDKLLRNWHIEYLCEVLEGVAVGKIKNLLINIQPRSLKSELVSVCFPCWRWLHNPEGKWLCLSYASSLANSHNQMRRDLMRSPFYRGLFPQLELKEDKNRISEFANNYRGEMVARGVSSAVTGVGSDAKGGMVFDDFNDVVRVESARIREEELRKFKDYSTGRKSDPKNTPTIIVQQRTHVQDISGYVLSEKADKYTYIKIPTRAKEPEKWESPITGKIIATRQPGELLHPERFGEEEDADALRTLGAYMYASRHAQEPYPASGGIFSPDWWRYYDEPPKRFIAAITVDCSFGSETNTASYVVIQLWLISRPYFYVHDQLRQRLTFPKTKAALSKLHKQWQEDLGVAIGPTLVEGKANGKAIIQSLQTSIPAIIEINPKESKKARAQAVAPMYESGNVLLLRSASWLQEYKIEFEAFPNYSSDDCVDASSQIIQYYLNRWRSQDSYDEGITGRIKVY